MPNPLLDLSGLPAFSQIKPEHAEPAIEQLLAENRNTIDALLAQETAPSWSSLVEPIELMEDRLGRAFSPVSHMNSVVNNEELRQAYNACLPKLSEYGTEMGQNEDLFRAYRQIADGDEYEKLDTAQRKVIDNAGSVWQEFADPAAAVTMLCKRKF